ncbi:hypothetical protein [Actinokineospora sp. NBRC 105648]|uniref:hypothetical protein n=1 Tax=Actinokineospora sp. NBRC 105648 TaxID=3032206 RepID=UPI0024A06FC9|nr:hypothetical protein [Actinokineospora sp. NBRC 105648]GLZ41101.1 hypothetical protein Acsp05_47250 [Actinokineospora sp. NBRC 105648]
MNKARLVRALVLAPLLALPVLTATAATGTAVAGDVPVSVGTGDNDIYLDVDVNLGRIAIN